ncbi:MAG: HAD-IA family hydrolase [Lachnospiraceae bacterium]|nr:HAD-IA family hydrolase [Lachnospiraceae bacterium]
MNYKAILFDFDYTLGDSTNGIVLSVNYALVKLGHVQKSVEDIRKTIGLSLKDTYFTLTGDNNLNAAMLFSKYFKEKADRVMVDNTDLYPNVKESLLSLRHHGCKIGIVTTKFHYRIQQILQKCNVPDLVDLIVGAEDVQIEKPNPEGLILAVEQLGLLKEEVLYVGDSFVDAQTAQNAGISFVGVLTGTTTREEFADYPNLYIGDTVAEIVNYVL